MLLLPVSLHLELSGQNRQHPYFVVTNTTTAVAMPRRPLRQTSSRSHTFSGGKRLHDPRPVGA
jgi:hypothetical protein